MSDDLKIIELESGEKIYEKVTAFDGYQPVEIQYMNRDGDTVGFFCYGSFDPNYPYQGQTDKLKSEAKSD